MYHDYTPHSGFAMARDQTDEFQVGHFRKFPNQLRGLATRDLNRVGVVVFHVRMLMHPLLMFANFGEGTKEKLVI
jgi:hypothetical protein